MRLLLLFITTKCSRQKIQNLVKCVLATKAHLLWQIAKNNTTNKIKLKESSMEITCPVLIGGN